MDSRLPVSDRSAYSGPSTVLIVEDDEASAKLIATMVTMAGYRVIGHGRTGREAVALALDLRPDIILMDLMMPEMDGLEATRRIMAAQPMPIIAVTAAVEPDIIREITQAGICGYIVKPSPAAKLADIMRLAPLRFEAAQAVLRSQTASHDGPAKIRLLVAGGTEAALWPPHDLEGFGVRMTVVGSALDALARIKQHAFDVLIMDMEQSDMPGRDFLEIVRLLHRNLAVVVRCPESTEDLAHDLLVQGADEVLARDAIAPEILRTLISARAHRSAGATLPDLHLALALPESPLRSDIARLAETALPVQVATLQPADNLAGLMHTLEAEILIAGLPLTGGRPGAASLLAVSTRPHARPPPALVLVVPEPRVALIKEALQFGAGDYMVPGATPVEILLTLARQVHTLRQQRAVSREQEKYRHLVENLSEGIWMIDRDANTTFASPKMAAMLGYSCEEMVGRHLFSFMDAPGVENCKRALDRRQQGIREQHEFEFLKKDGTRLTTLLETSPVLDEHGAYAGAIAGVLDITDRKKQDELVLRAGKMATLGALVAGVAHEINNPNNVVALNISMLQRVWDEALPVLKAATGRGELQILAGLPAAEMMGEVDNLLAGIGRSSGRIKRIVDLLKDYAREKTPCIKHSPLQLNEVLQVAMELAGNRLKHATHGLAVSLAPGLPMVSGNFQRLEQVFVNLLVNACEALTAPEQAIRVETRFLPETNQVQAIISDEGMGMSPETLQRIFDPFFTTRHDHGGTGLGVPIAQSIVAEHQGALEYQSAPGQGTRASITLPALVTEKN